MMEFCALLILLMSLQCGALLKIKKGHLLKIKEQINMLIQKLKEELIHGLPNQSTSIYFQLKFLI